MSRLEKQSDENCFAILMRSPKTSRCLFCGTDAMHRLRVHKPRCDDECSVFLRVRFPQYLVAVVVPQQVVGMLEQ